MFFNGAEEQLSKMGVKIYYRFRGILCQLFGSLNSVEIRSNEFPFAKVEFSTGKMFNSGS